MFHLDTFKKLFSYSKTEKKGTLKYTVLVTLLIIDTWFSFLRRLLVGQHFDRFLLHLINMPSDRTMRVVLFFQVLSAYQSDLT